MYDNRRMEEITTGVLGVLLYIGGIVFVIWLTIWFFTKIGEIAATLRHIEGHLAGEAMARNPANTAQPPAALPPQVAPRRPLRPGLNLDLS